MKQRHDKEKVVADAENFAKTHDLADYSDLFGRAALVARDKHFQSIPELLPDEMTALQYELDHKWHGSKMLWYSIGLCAVGAATQGEWILVFRVPYLGPTANVRLGSNWI